MDFPLEISGQQPGLNGLYTQLCLSFPTAGTSDSTILDSLNKGLEQLSKGFPWIAGQVINDGGLFKLASLDKTPRLVVKDMRDDASMTLDVLRKAKFPFSLLDENVIAPRNTLPGTGPPSDSAPVFLVQVSFIAGGLLLTLVAQHNVMDMAGQSQMIYLLSKACRGEEFTSEELSTGTLSERGIIPLLGDSWMPGPEVDHQISKPAPPGASPPPPAKSSWSYFIFSSASLGALKARATESLSSGFVSTDDTLSAFIWQCVMRSRCPRLDTAKDATFARAIDTRRFVGIPAAYPGLVQNMTYSTSSIQTLIDAPLGTVASQLRSAIDPEKLAHSTRALVTLLTRATDIGSISVTATLELSKDIMLSSWVKEPFYEYDFGFGKPEAVRRPGFIPVESLMYLMPKRLDGEIAVALCLRDDDLERLKADEDWSRYGIYVG